MTNSTLASTPLNLAELEAALSGNETYALDDWCAEIKALLEAARQNERLKALLRRVPNGVSIRAELREDIAKEIGND